MGLKFRKLKAAVHYVWDKGSRNPASFDGIKANKVLWYADCSAYLARGFSITGETYIRKPHGPVAKHNWVAVTELEKDGAVRRGRENESGEWHARVDSMVPPDTSELTGEELRIIDEVFRLVCLHDTPAISDRTHGAIWSLAADGEPIPLFAVFAEKLGQITPEHRQAAMEGLC